MKKLFVYLFAFTALTLASCKGTTKTGGDQADSGQTNIGSSGPADSAITSASTPQQMGTSGTDTSATGKGSATPTTDTLKTKPAP